MAVADYIMPIQNHHSGIPPQFMYHMKRLNKQSPKAMIDLAIKSYEKVLTYIERALNGDVPSESEAQAADIASHLILDAAFMHDCLSHAGCIVGKFPYDYLADKILPRKETVQ